MSERINRLQTKIKVLKEVLDRGTFVIIAPGDPDYPEGLELPLPKTWVRIIKKAIRKLVKDLRDEIDALDQELQ